MTTIINPMQERTGTIKQWPSVSVPAGWLVCDGSAVSRELYAGLFEVIGSTFGAGDGETTFNLPDLQDKFIEGCGVNSLGVVKTAGLPELVGRFGNSTSNEKGPINGNTFSGACYGTQETSAHVFSTGNTSTTHCHTVNFVASTYNAIYGNSTTVQPPAVVMNYIIKF